MCAELFSGRIYEGQFGCLLGTIFASLSVLSIWRRYVRWTGLRVTSTVALTILMITQVLLWKPIWSSTQCAVEEHLRFGQSTSCLGLWSGTCSLIWWGGLLFKKVHARHLGSTWRNPMNAQSVRLCIAWSLTFFLPGLYFVIWGGLKIFTSYQDKTETAICYEVCGLVAVLTWLLLWRSRVLWNPRTATVTLLLVATVLIAPLTVLAPRSPASLQGSRLMPLYEVFRYLTPLFAAGLWFAGTAWLWRSDRTDLPAGLDSDSDMSAFVRCGDCGYSLVGLREVRCPECGWQSTVDEAVRRGMAELIELRGAAVT